MSTNKVYFVITKKCNKSCSFCYMRYNNVNISDIKTLIDIKESIDHLIIIGGEPLIDLDRVIQILHICKDVPEITITTNGVLLNDIIMKKLSKYKNTYIQISIYDYLSAVRTAGLIQGYDRCIIHYLLSNDNINIFKLTHNMFKNHRIWLSIDREITTDISSEIIDLIDSGDLTIDMFRNTTKVGKDCKVFSHENIVINGSEIVYDCLNRQSRGTIMSINQECLKCKNVICDACICDDIVNNRSVICTIFKNIYDKFKFQGDI